MSKNHILPTKDQLKQPLSLELHNLHLELRVIPSKPPSEDLFVGQNRSYMSRIDRFLGRLKPLLASEGQGMSYSQFIDMIHRLLTVPMDDPNMLGAQAKLCRTLSAKEPDVCGYGFNFRPLLRVIGYVRLQRYALANVTPLVIAKALFPVYTSSAAGEKKLRRCANTISDGSRSSSGVVSNPLTSGYLGRCIQYCHEQAVKGSADGGPSSAAARTAASQAKPCTTKSRTASLSLPDLIASLQTLAQQADPKPQTSPTDGPLMQLRMPKDTDALTDILAGCHTSRRHSQPLLGVRRRPTLVEQLRRKQALNAPPRIDLLSSPQPHPASGRRQRSPFVLGSVATTHVSLAQPLHL